MKSRYYACPVIFLAALSLLAPGVARADDAAEAAKMMPADATAHGQPMKMKEPMPTKMKKDGMMIEDVMKGETKKKEVMDETLKQEESKMGRDAK
ncbi:MAG TPA: hypothetical protein VMH34_00840 [Gammaproteobacteria bacterium]|nr:hypothetical protein [Gammaproteobacteria bacterium]